MQPDFIYFDFGNILFRFCHERMLRQMAAVAGVDVAAMRAAVFNGPLGEAFDRGDITPQTFYEQICGPLQVSPTFDALEEACSDIFEPIPETCAVATDLVRRGVRCGVLSNTNASHWTFAIRQFPGGLPKFDVLALSYEMRLVKPRSEIYRRAAEMANADPRRILFFDDRPENIAGAAAEGWDAVLIEDPLRIRSELIARAVINA